MIQSIRGSSRGSGARRDSAQPDASSKPGGITEHSRKRVNGLEPSTFSLGSKPSATERARTPGFQGCALPPGAESGDGNGGPRRSIRGSTRGSRVVDLAERRKR